MKAYECIFQLGTEASICMANTININTPHSGPLNDVYEINSYLAKEYEFLHKHLNTLIAIRFFVAGFYIITEYVGKLKENGKDFPVSSIERWEAGQLISLRIYHSHYSLNQSHQYRPSLFQKEVFLKTLPIPKSVVTYFESIGKGDVDATMNTYTKSPNIILREPAGVEWIYRGYDAIRAHYVDIFQQGGVPLTFHQVHIGSGHVAFEYTCDKWGENHLKPQAGMSIYHFASDSKIQMCLIYDDVNDAFTL